MPRFYSSVAWSNVSQLLFRKIRRSGHFIDHGNADRLIAKLLEIAKMFGRVALAVEETFLLPFSPARVNGNTEFVSWQQRALLPDRPFRNFRAVRSGDRWIVCSPGASYHGYWSSKLIKGSVGSPSSTLISNGNRRKQTLVSSSSGVWLSFRFIGQLLWLPLLRLLLLWSVHSQKLRLYLAIIQLAHVYAKKSINKQSDYLQFIELSHYRELWSTNQVIHSWVYMYILQSYKKDKKVRHAGEENIFLAPEFREKDSKLTLIFFSPLSSLLLSLEFLRGEN